MLDASNFQTDKHRHSHAQNRFAVMPTAKKLNAKKQFTGKGVCIAFLDSGFYPYADFAERVVAFHDIAAEERSFHSILEPKGHHWHGTQTVTSCAGNGALSDGVWRAAINCLKQGKYRSKLFVNGDRWTEDTSYGLKEEDGFGEFHSILMVE